MGKGSSLKADELFARAERVRRESAALTRQLATLRELRALDRDFRRVAQKLALTMNSRMATETRDGLRYLLDEAEEFLLTSPPPPKHPFAS
jgi:hypothetical protein